MRRQRLPVESLRLLSTIVLIGAALPAARAAPVEIKIAVELPFGENPFDCQGILNGVDLAIRDAGSIHGGQYSVTLAPRDLAPHEDEQHAIDNANADIESGVVAVIGPFNSASAFFFNPIYNEARVAVISPSNTNPALTKDEDPVARFPTGALNYCRVVTTDDEQGAASARWCAAIEAERVVVVSDGFFFGDMVANSFLGAAEGAGLDILASRALERNGRSEAIRHIEALAREIAALAPDMVYFGGISHDAVNLAKHLRSAGYGGRFMGPDGIIDPYLIHHLGEGAEGIRATIAGIDPQGLTDPEVVAWIDRYEATYQEDLAAYSALGYVAGQVLVAALERVPDPTDRDAVREAIVTTQDFRSLLGTFGFDENGDTTLTVVSGYRIEGGEFRFDRLIP